jgi:MerR family transcriptional regulator, light-induced transcriptional regulator
VPPPEPSTRLVESLVDAVTRFDSSAIDREIGRLASLYAPREFVYSLVLPLMSAVGQRWDEGSLSVAQEHVVSAVLVGVMSSLVRLQTVPAGARRLLFACPAGERHEFGLLAAAILAGSKGYGTVYLGADVPSADIAAAASLANVEAAVIAVTGGQRTVKARVPEIRRLLAPSIDLWVGGSGPAAVDHPNGKSRRLVRLTTLEAFERQLATMAP